MHKFLSPTRLLSYGLTVILLLNASLCFAAEENLNFMMLSSSKNIGNGYTLIGAAGDIHEEFAGKVAYLGVAKKAASDLVWRAGYFGYYPKSINGNGYREDHRLRGSLSYTVKLDEWKLMHRSRVEYRMGQVSTGLRYRPAVELSRTLSVAQSMLIPYIEVEPFYDFHADKLTLTLLTAGVKWPVTPNIILNIGHMNVFLNEEHRHVKGPILGLHIKL
jgi:hypothetical protein